ncbi:unnamed protein product, partial [Mesorhabditis belari]|uniref:C-type lectin domain-containing protein n=1 Tax=Mesorhabditis belari TaxID=2138241 RepID=A0AAF3JAJ9_9BILA
MKNKYEKETGVFTVSSLDTAYRAPILPTRDLDAERKAHLKETNHKLSILSLIICSYAIGATIYVIFLLIYSINLQNNLNVAKHSIQRTLPETEKIALVFQKANRRLVQGDCNFGWIHFQNYCYYYHNFTSPKIYGSRLFTFMEAEENCRHMHSHLVSIHSQDEHEFINDVILTWLERVIPIAENDLDGCQRDHYVWIGLHSNGSRREWTDGSPDDYLHEQRDFIYFDMCNDVFRKSKGEFRNFFVERFLPNRRFSRYICKKTNIADRLISFGADQSHGSTKLEASDDL